MASEDHPYRKCYARVRPEFQPNLTLHASKFMQLLSFHHSGKVVVEEWPTCYELPNLRAMIASSATFPAALATWLCPRTRARVLAGGFFSDAIAEDSAVSTISACWPSADVAAIAPTTQRRSVAQLAPIAQIEQIDSLRSSNCTAPDTGT